MNRKILVAYFSASGVTAKIAEKLAAATGADIYEIKPERPYTSADLDWTNKKSRSTVEMNDPAFRPAIAGELPDMGKYDSVFLGFPIWWYVAPTIVNTFWESRRKKMRLDTYRAIAHAYLCRHLRQHQRGL